MKKGITQVVLVFMLSVSAFAQSNREYVTSKMFWSEVVVVGKIKNKFSYQFDYQYRRAANADDATGANVNTSNMFAHPFQQVLRPWIHYQLNNDVRFSLSPMGWWGTWNAGNSKTTFIPELRICPQITLNQKLGRMIISQRYRYEFRFFGNTKQVMNGWDLDPDNSYYNLSDDNHRKGRFRYFFRTLIPLNNANLKTNTLYINAFDEVFLNIGKQVKNTNLLDQNRLFLGVGYRFEKEFRVELGYLSQTAFRFNNSTQTNVEQNNILQIGRAHV